MQSVKEKLNVENTNSIDGLEFEGATREKKGAATEDSGLKILAGLAKKYKYDIKVIERVAPSAIGEFDAICCTDSGLIVVELKRYGGCFWPFNIRCRSDRTWCSSNRRRNRLIKVPRIKSTGRECGSC